MRQTTTYTCGSASVAVIIMALRNLIGEPQVRLEEKKLSAIMRARPRNGIEIDALVGYMKSDPIISKRNISHGPNTYSGGLAIANIKNWRSGGGHYVIFLGEDSDGRMKIYDVISGEIHRKASDEYEWSNSDGSLVRWSVNIDLDSDDLAKVVEYLSNLRDNIIHIITGHGDDDRSLSDNARYMKEIYEKEGIQVNVSSDNVVSISNNILRIGSAEVSRGDTVWVKMDPRNEVRYYAILRILSPFEELGINFINPPSKILAYDDKAIPLALNLDSSFVGVSNNHISAGLYVLNTEKVIVKDFLSWGGKKITHCDSYQDITSVVPKNSPFIIQRQSYNIGEQISTRLIWYAGKFIGCVDRERFKGDFSRRIEEEEFFLGDIKMLQRNQSLWKSIEKISNFLTNKGFVIAEISVLNYSLITKVVVSNPGTIKIYIELSGDNFLKS